VGALVTLTDLDFVKYSIFLNYYRCLAWPQVVVGGLQHPLMYVTFVDGTSDDF
jgi:hypothetical protein